MEENVPNVNYCLLCVVKCPGASLYPRILLFVDSSTNRRCLMSGIAHCLVNSTLRISGASSSSLRERSTSRALATPFLSLNAKQLKSQKACKASRARMSTTVQAAGNGSATSQRKKYLILL